MRKLRLRDIKHCAQVSHTHTLLIAMSHCDTISTIPAPTQSREGLPGGDPAMSRTIFLLSSRWKQKSQNSWGSGTTLYPCPTAPPRGPSHTHYLACCQRGLGGLPEKLALVSLRPAPNTQECAGCSAPAGGQNTWERAGDKTPKRTMGVSHTWQNHHCTTACPFAK